LYGICIEIVVIAFDFITSQDTCEFVDFSLFVSDDWNIVRQRLVDLV